MSAQPLSTAWLSICRSQIEAAYQKLVRMTGATLSLQEFAALYAHDPGKKRPKNPVAMDDAFMAGTTLAERAVWAEIEKWNRAEAAILEQELFANRKRAADAGRSLRSKETKKAREDVRIAGNKIDRAMGKLADLKRVEGEDRDSRIFPWVYAPVDESTVHGRGLAWPVVLGVSGSG